MVMLWGMDSVANIGLIVWLGFLNYACLRIGDFLA